MCSLVYGSGDISTGKIVSDMVTRTYTNTHEELSHYMKREQRVCLLDVYILRVYVHRLQTLRLYP